MVNAVVAPNPLRKAATVLLIFAGLVALGALIALIVLSRNHADVGVGFLVLAIGEVQAAILYGLGHTLLAVGELRRAVVGD